MFFFNLLFSSSIYENRKKFVFCRTKADKENGYLQRKQENDTHSRPSKMKKNVKMVNNIERKMNKTKHKEHPLEEICVENKHPE